MLFRFPSDLLAAPLATDCPQRPQGILLGLCSLLLATIGGNRFPTIPACLQDRASWPADGRLSAAQHEKCRSLCVVQCPTTGTTNRNNFMETPLRIMVTKQQAENYFERNLLPAVLRERLFFVSWRTLIDHRDALNTSYAYLATTSGANILKLKQENMQQPLLRLVRNIETCTPQFFIGVPVQWNSPFKESFFNFYLRSLRSGLQKRWKDNS